MASLVPPLATGGLVNSSMAQAECLQAPHRRMLPKGRHHERGFSETCHRPMHTSRKRIRPSHIASFRLLFSALWTFRVCG